MRNVTFAATQMACTDNVEENIDKAEKLIRSAKDKGADIVLIQELFSYLYFCQVVDRSFYVLAKEEENNPMLERMSQLAKELEMVIPVSFFEETELTRFNSIVIFDADGTKLGKYRKTHIPDDPGYYEKFYFAPGDTGFKVWDTKFCKLGVGICWDQWFPEAARCMCMKGAEVLMYPTAIGTFAVPPEELKNERIYNAHWQNTMAGHAGANVVPVISSNRVGTEYLGNTAMSFFGSSFITDECGNLVETMDMESEGVVTHTFDLDELAEIRREYPFYRDRRPEMYGALMSIDGR